MSRFAVAELHVRTTRRIGQDFLRTFVARVPYRSHTVLTDDSDHFAEPGAWSIGEISALRDRQQLFRVHAFTWRASSSTSTIDSPNPIIRGRMDTHATCERTWPPYERIGDLWTQQLQRITLTPDHLMTGLNI